MGSTRKLSSRLALAGWGMTFILWGITILFDFIPFSVGILGTGLILLGANAIRLLNKLPSRSNNTLFGILALAWGGLELARPILRQLLKVHDPDWAIFAILLVVFGAILLARAAMKFHKANLNEAS